MTTVVVGVAGQVGQHLQSLLPGAGFLSRQQADLTDPRTLEAALRAFEPSIIVNAAAYTAVDRAESEAAVAWQVNAAAPALLASVAASLEAAVIHISTDFVFDGAARRPYRETDGARPVNVYGRTKLAGDLAVQSLCERHWILRTSWVFSEHGSNFVKTMLRLAGEKASIGVVSDQRGRPTFAGDLARQIAALVSRLNTDQAPLPGLYHCGGGPECSWFDLAAATLGEAFDRGMIDRMPGLEPIPTSAYPTPAARPKQSTLEPNEAFQTQLGVEVDWRAGLTETLGKLKHERSEA